MSKKKRERAEEFIGWKSEDGLLEVVGVHGKQKDIKTFKVVCHKCIKDTELFPLGYFVSTKGSLIKGHKPCGCSNSPQWTPEQYLINANRSGEGRFIVHGFAEEFKGVRTKLDLECIKDGYKWTADVSNAVSLNTGCQVCKSKTLSDQKKTPESIAFKKCIEICEEMNYKPLCFPYGYKNNKSRFEYVCPIHGLQNVRYNHFVNYGSRCSYCCKDRLIESGNGNGYYPKRKDEIDFLYILNFNDQFIKVGRSFNVSERLKTLRTSSKIPIKRIYKLRIFTATHQEIYDLEQELHSELREHNFQHYVDWSTECFESDSLFILNKLLDTCGLKEVTCA